MFGTEGKGCWNKVWSDHGECGRMPIGENPRNFRLIGGTAVWLTAVCARYSRESIV